MAPATLSVARPEEPGHEARAKPSEAAPSTLAPGVRLGTYELLIPIASGGMGHVWSAVRIGDFGFRRAVAIKVMREELAADPEFRRMFLDEARLASRVTHGNVVEVLDLGEGAGVLYQAMELVEGDSLSRLVSASVPIPAGVIARIVADVLRGLHAAHELRGEDQAPLGLVHRDVSPQNILVGLDGIAKITDFGIAKAAGVAQVISHSGRRGKLAYMPAEQRDGGALDRRCDVFAAGVVLWELLAARKREPDADVPHPCDLNPPACRPLADVAMSALASRPDDRFATAEQMADAIERVAHAAGLALSSRSVAAWVSELAGGQIKKRREDTEAQLARTLAGTTNTMEDAASGPHGRRGSVGRYVAGALLAAGAAVGAFAMTRSRAPLPTPAPAVAAVTAEPAPSATPAPPAAAAEDSAPVTAPSASPPAPAVHPRPVRRPRSAPDLPKYKNPY